MVGGETAQILLDFGTGPSSGAIPTVLLLIRVMSWSPAAALAARISECRPGLVVLYIPKWMSGTTSDAANGPAPRCHCESRHNESRTTAANSKHQQGRPHKRVAHESNHEPHSHGRGCRFGSKAASPMK